MSTLRDWTPYSIAAVLDGPYGEWIMWGVVAIAFIALAGAALPRHLTEKRSGKTLTIALGLVLTIGLFMARDIYHFSLETFAFIAIAILAIVMSFIVYGLSKTSLPKHTAFALTYAGIFGSFFFISPTLYDALAESFPPIGGIGMTLFIISLVMLTLDALRMLTRDRKTGLTTPVVHPPEIKAEEAEIKQQENQELREDLPAIRKEGLTIERMLEILRALRLSNADPQSKIEIIKNVGSRTQEITAALAMLRNHAEVDKLLEVKTARDMRKRLEQTTDPRTRALIKKEMGLERHRFEVFEFIIQHEKRIMQWEKIFLQNLTAAIDHLSNGRIDQASNHLKAGEKDLGTMRHILERLLSLEKVTVRVINKERRILNKEARV